MKSKYPEGTSVIIGYDHRHNSKLFALSSAQVYLAYGHKVRIFPDIVPTPFVPSSLQCLNVGLGVMVTASHNPKKDNGYKVYGANGAQIVDHVAKEIVEFISRERARFVEIKNAPQFVIDEEDSKELMEKVTSWYIEKLTSFLAQYKSENACNPRVVYTPLHGVGGKYVHQVFEAIFGDSTKLVSVPAQMMPDPDFPTVDFPNPEEGASTLKLAMAEADLQGINHVFANDPDADRFCLAEKDAETGAWRIFNGNEIAVLLADFIASKVTSDDFDFEYVMLASCVSSRFLEKYCRRRGWHFESTSTGFKNLGNRGLQLKNDSKKMKILFAYEEAIGFQVGDWNFDKDGISAMMTFYSLMRFNEKLSLSSVLSRIYEAEGVWPLQFNGYYICKPASRIKPILQSIKAPAGSVFKNDGSVVTVEYPSKGVWLMLRSSGTEPKLKYYSEMLLRGDYKGDNADIERMEFEEMMRRIIEEMIEPEKNGLI